LFLAHLPYSLHLADYMIKFIASGLTIFRVITFFSVKQITKCVLQTVLPNPFLNRINIDGSQTFCLLTLNPFYFQWIPELKHYAPGVPIILVGTKLGKNDSVLFFLKSNLRCLQN
jgi:hypothetical protein